MKKLLFVIWITLTICPTLKAAEVNPSSEIKEVIPNDLYVCTIAPDYHYILERVNDETRKFWIDFGYKQHNEISCARSFVHGVQTNQGAQGFSSVIGNKSDYLYVAYVTRQYVKNTMSVNYEDIEMSFCVSTDNNLPWSSHMGISRNPLYNMANHTQHKNISATLHSFAAKVINLLHPQKLYMITRPVTTMWNILLQVIPEGKIFVGDNHDKEKSIKFSTEAQEFCDEYKVPPHFNPKFVFYLKAAQVATRYESPIFSAGSKTNSSASFTIKNQQGETIFFLTEANQSKHDWFFDSDMFFPIFTGAYNPLCTIDLEALANLSPYWDKITEFKK